MSVAIRERSRPHGWTVLRSAPDYRSGLLKKKFIMSLRLHRVRPNLRPCISQLSTTSRYASSTSTPRQADEVEEGKREVQDEEESGTETYEGWIRSEGRKWQYPDTSGPKWLGGNVVRLLLLTS